MFVNENFLVFSLCDNDFGHHIYKAVEYAMLEDFIEYAGTDCRWWKAYIISFVLTSCQMRWYQECENQKHTQNYLEEKLQVYVSRDWPTYDGVRVLDHGGGSVVLDLNTKIISLI